MGSKCMVITRDQFQKTSQKAVGEAGAKFILIGEHFVVHGGVTALCFPVRTMKTRVVIEFSPVLKDILCQCTVLDINEVERPLPLVARAMEKSIPIALEQFELHNVQGGYRISSRSNFPVSRGFGSSASFAAATARALNSLVANKGADKVKITVDALERHFHGNPSGIDGAAILAGVPIKFKDGKVLGTFKNTAADFVLVDGGSRDACKEIISTVAKMREAKPSQWEHLAITINQASIAAEKAMVNSDQGELALAINQTHEVLSSLSLSTPQIDQIIAYGLEHGALSGKVSGAGAGGATVLQAHPGDGPRLARELKEAGITVLGWEPAHDA